MKPLDWIAIAVYMLGMLGIGEYYARRNKSTEDYLLGGRKMGSKIVGLSLFASLLSTNSYLSYPGEMIQNGPLAIATVLTYPLVFVIVGYGLIPFFMKLHVTSAYEILEKRFGLSVRMLGSTMFLSLRLLWMGMIVYITASTVLVPVMGLSQDATPYVCMVMGLITVVYTSIGGLRAVVVADAIQSFILLSGAVLALVIITASLGGFSQWWPTLWSDHWQTFRIGFHSTDRTVMAAILMQTTWWICTGGSDQMAIQRYLATRDRHTARQVLGVSLLTSFVTITLLALLGLALLGYFQANPELAEEGATASNQADKLFPRFVVIGFPPGITGLVVAGILAAAMSSLSSGFNSSSLVIEVDFFERLGLSAKTEAQKLRRAKNISWVVGTVVVVASMLVNLIPGNLFDVNQKTSNLMVAPLFVLFFMAMFVPWATLLGVWAGGIAATAMAIRIAFFPNVPYFGEFTLGVLWIMPASLAAGITVGCLVSLLTISHRRPPLLSGR